MMGMYPRKTRNGLAVRLGDACRLTLIMKSSKVIPIKGSKGSTEQAERSHTSTSIFRIMQFVSKRGETIREYFQG